MLFLDTPLPPPQAPTLPIPVCAAWKLICKVLSMEQRQYIVPNHTLFFYGPFHPMILKSLTKIDKLSFTHQRYEVGKRFCSRIADWENEAEVGHVT